MKNIMRFTQCWADVAAGWCPAAPGIIHVVVLKIIFIIEYSTEGSLQRCKKSKVDVIMKRTKLFEDVLSRPPVLKNIANAEVH